MDIVEIKQKIKEWEYAFRERNNRQPSKIDVKENSTICKLYSLYRAMKLGKQPTEVPKREAVTQSPVRKNVFSPKGELGPTPQANGRVLSIFDFKMTPPESSPLKRKSTSSTINIASPLKSGRTEMPPPDSPIKRIVVETPTKNRVRSFATPTKPRALDFTETPGYRSRNLQTPTSDRNANAGVDFQVSPSPLKPLRGIGKRLADLYESAIKEATMLESLEFNQDVEYKEGEESSSEDEGENKNNDNKTGLKRKRTQKRLTRRVKMAPRPVEDKQTLDNVNIQAEMTHMEEKERKHIEAYINSEEEDEYEEKGSVFESPIKKTRKPMANNYQRLKINDPRAKRFKQRMRRR